MDGVTVLVLGLVVAAGALTAGFHPGVRTRLRRRREFRRRSRLEDLLKHIFNCQGEGPAAGLDSVAGHLGLSRKKAFHLILQVEAAGLLRSEAGRLHLTAEGEKLALQVIRAHRLWETYLANEARMPVPKVHGQAEREEHRLLADQRVDELDARLGHPRSDPHGDPIPTAAGAIERLDAQPLTSWPAGVEAEIVHVEDEPEPVLRHITEQGLKPGSTVLVLDRSQEQVTLSDGEKRYRLAPMVAANIQVAPKAPAQAGAAAVLRLSELPADRGATIVSLDAELRGFTRRRLLDLGLTPNSAVSAQLVNPFGDPRAYRIRGTTIALRREQASKIWVRPEP